ncbi:MAG: M48 family metallopeptidase [Vicinamibacterales bacterium]
MQLALPFAQAPSAVRFVRHRGARRYILRVLADGTLRVTVPRGGSRREATAFVERSADWVARQLELRGRERQVDRAWRDGTPVLLDGEARRLTVAVAPHGVVVTLGGEPVLTSAALEAHDVRAAVEAWLRRRATRDLPPALLALADRHGIGVARVSVRDQQSRWGSCSRRGTITLNWRLVQTPPFVREYVLLHELMHRRELNHSRRFWRLVADVCPRHAEARRWLLREGRTLF